MKNREQSNPLELLQVEITKDFLIPFSSKFLSFFEENLIQIISTRRSYFVQNPCLHFQNTRGRNVTSLSHLSPAFISYQNGYLIWLLISQGLLSSWFWTRTYCSNRFHSSLYPFLRDPVGCFALQAVWVVVLFLVQSFASQAEIASSGHCSCPNNKH